ncbi:MAG: PDZ domain-containing protein [Planctomycetes bacterium]|nr:PDZ domain-containing protein [Planctomycetota bacterium]
MDEENPLVCSPGMVDAVGTMRKLSLLLPLLFCLCYLSAPIVGQEKAVNIPPRNAKAGDFAHSPLGPIGGRGEVVADDATILVLDVSKDGPGATAGMQKGDVIIAAAKAKFPAHSRDINQIDGPLVALGNAIEKAEAKSGQLKLSILRDGAEMQLDIQLPALGKMKPQDPKNLKANQFYQGVCSDLLKTRRADGAWKANTGEDATRYTTALCGLALLGRGNPDDLPALEKIAVLLAGPERRGYVSTDLMEPAGLSNWFITMSGIYLSEYVLATGDNQWLPTIQHLCDCLAARQTENGRYGHGITVGYGGKGFNIINTHAHLLWALADRAGCNIDQKAWQRSFAEIQKSTGENGGVRYWTLETGYWDACARTGQMALALSLAGEAPKLQESMGRYLQENHRRMREAHAMSSIGMIFGTAALRRVNPKGWQQHMDSWLWYLTLMRQPDGSAEYIGGKRNNGGDHYLGKPHLANAIAGLMLASRLDHLHIFGNDQKGWMALPK